MITYSFGAIVGTRHEPTAESLQRVLHHLRNEIPMSWHVVTGDCPTGIDVIAAAFAMECGKACMQMVAPWDRLGNPRAAHVRNQAVANVARRLFAFLCRHARGTFDTIRRCKERGVMDEGFAIDCVDPSA